METINRSYPESGGEKFLMVKVNMPSSDKLDFINDK